MGDSTATMVSALSRWPTVNQAVSLFPRHGRKEDWRRVSRKVLRRFSMLGPVEENDARIRAVLVGEDRSHRVQVVDEGRIDAARFDEISAGNRPVRLARNGVSRRQFVKRRAFLLGAKRR